MARKDRSQWTDAYRRRIERGEARGQSKAEARGHRTASPGAGRSEYRERQYRRAVLIMQELATPNRVPGRRRGEYDTVSYDEIEELFDEHGIAPTIRFLLKKNTIRARYRLSEAYSYQGSTDPDITREWSELQDEYEDWNLSEAWYAYH
jgi:hypothetical protein